MLQETIQHTSPLNGRIKFLIRNNVSCDYHRLQLPAETMGIDTRLNANDATVDIFCRTQEQPIEKYLSGRDGRKLIVDVDDYWHLYPHHYLFGSWNSCHTAENITQAMRAANIVTVTNEYIYRRATHYNKRVEILPNALPFDFGQFKLKDNSGKTAFFWAGGASHMHDLSLLRAVMANTPYDLTLMGDDGGGQWAKIRTSFAGRAKVVKFLPVDSYMTGYQGNVMLVPLEDNFFNQHKSNLKILEAGCKGMAVIASKMHPYHNVRDVPYVMYADSPAQWQAHIRYCIANPGFVQEMGSALSDHVRREYHLKDINIKRRQIYELLIK